MSTMSWKTPLVVLFATGLAAAACGGDDAKSSTEPVVDSGSGTGGGDSGGPTCGNGKVDTGEKCDKTAFGSATCATETMGSMVKAGGKLTCSADCKTITTTACTATGTGGATSSGGAPSGGAGGGTPTDGGMEAGDGSMPMDGSMAADGSTAADTGGGSGGTQGSGGAPATDSGGPG